MPRKIVIVRGMNNRVHTSTKKLITVLDEYLTQGTGAKIIGNIHGHTHNCNVYTIGTSKIGRFAIPQICVGRYNEDSSYEYMDEWSDFAPDGKTPIYYYKGENDATDTHFVFVVIDCENEKFWAINYGVTTAVTADKTYSETVEMREIPFKGEG